MNLNDEDYVAKISSASPLDLVVINFELIIQNIQEAEQAFKCSKIEDFKAKLQKAHEFLKLLMSSLNMDYKISKELMEIYFFISDLLIKAGIQKDINKALDAEQMLTTLMESFKTLQDFESKESVPVMENAQQLFAGLTYKDGKLSEYVVEKPNRGFKA